MITSAINSGAINAVSFPSVERGLSIVQLLGTAEVVPYIQKVQLRLTATAIKPAVVSCSANYFLKRGVEAIQIAEAGVPAVGIWIKVPVTPVTEAKASTTANAVVIRYVQATTPALAVSSVTSYQRTKRSASTVSFGNGSVSAYRGVFFSVNEAAKATVSAAALTKRSAALHEVVRVTSSVTPRLVRRIAASVDTTANTAVFEERHIHSAALTVATETSAVTPKLVIAAPANTLATAEGSAVFNMRLATGGDASAAAITYPTDFIFHLTAEASTVVELITVVAGLDFSYTFAAPLNRQMIVKRDPVMKVIF